jgi:tRNA(His) 5'-end guanylyltransferase
MDYSVYDFDDRFFNIVLSDSTVKTKLMTYLCIVCLYLFVMYSLGNCAFMLLFWLHPKHKESVNPETVNNYTTMTEIAPYGRLVAGPIPVELADRMKYYERLSKNIVQIDRNHPFVIRLDGRAFSKFTAKFKKYGEIYYKIPYSPEFKRAMILTTHDLIHEFSTSCGYTHSDEITLVFPARKEEGSMHPFDGKVDKLLSLVASFATARFIYYMEKEMDRLELVFGEQKQIVDYGATAHLCKPASISVTPTFDARLIVFPIEKTYEIANLLMWRSRGDCNRNFVSMFAEKYIGKDKLNKLKTYERVNKLVDVGLLGFSPNDENLDYSMKCGVFLKRLEHVTECNKKDKLTTKCFVFKTFKFSDEMVKFLTETNGYNELMLTEGMKLSNPLVYDERNINILLYHVPDYTKSLSQV